MEEFRPMKRFFATATVATALVLGITAPALAQTKTWDIDSSHSAASFAVKHLMVATVRGEFGKLSGQVSFDGKDFAGVKAAATIDVSTINTREPKRDEHLKGPDFFDVATYPTITFTSKRAEAAGPNKFRLIGDLTMRGVTREVALDVEATAPVKGMRGETRVGAQATTRINRQDFGVTWNRSLDTGGVVVGDEVTVTIDLSLVEKGDAAPKASN
jgi:polyisoprenoid-binding protein YceI